MSSARSLWRLLRGVFRQRDPSVPRMTRYSVAADATSILSVGVRRPGSGESPGSDVVQDIGKDRQERLCVEGR